jgi:hypothetical protein
VEVQIGKGMYFEIVWKHRLVWHIGISWYQTVSRGCEPIRAGGNLLTTTRSTPASHGYWNKEMVQR